MLHLLVFHAYINEITVQETKSPVKNLVRQRWAEGFNFGVKGLMNKLMHERYVNKIEAETRKHTNKVKEK
jgi:hypothetical protein